MTPVRRFTLLLALAAASPLAAQDPQSAEPRSRVAVEYGHVAFSGDELEGWHLVTAEASHRAGAATLVGRVNWAERLGRSGAQVEAEAYPRLGGGAYLYLNAGYSGAAIFPELRTGAELYGPLGNAFEGSAGARRLWFEASSVTILTGSVAKYAGDYYVALRPYVTPRDGETAFSGSLLVRRYFGGPESFATVVVGGGSAPSEAPLEFEVERLGSARLSLWGRHPLTARLGLRWSAGWEREETAEEARRTRLSVGAGLDARF